MKENRQYLKIFHINPIQANVPFLYPPEKIRKPLVFNLSRGYRKGPLT